MNEFETKTIPHDPDFDDNVAEFSVSKKEFKSFFDSFSSKGAFILGLALAVGGLATIGFFVLLFAFFR